MEKERSPERKKVWKTEDEWRRVLTPEQYRVTRQKATERAFTGKYLNNREKGVYSCACCGAALFSSDAKYDSGSGWPTFFEPVNDDAIETETDRTLLWETRTEILCAQCGSHLGHVFNDGPLPTGKRYCVNSTSLQFEKK